MEQKQLKNTLEALLFVSGKPLKVKDFVKILETDEIAIKSALDSLSLAKKDSGLVILEYSPTVKNFLNAELREKLTDATVEVLAIIAYRQPISKAEIEAIRGVSSQYSLRNLLIRGMIEKVSNPSDARSVYYQTTTEFLMHLGIGSVKELADFEKLVEHIKLPQTPGLSQAESTSQTAEPEEEVLPTTTIPSAKIAGSSETAMETREGRVVMEKEALPVSTPPSEEIVESTKPAIEPTENSSSKKTREEEMEEDDEDDEDDEE
jgi:segregation and condensation protein B